MKSATRLVKAMTDFLERPEAIADLSRDELAKLFVKARALEGALLAKLLSATHPDGDAAARDESPPGDRTLDANALAERLGVSRRTLFRTVERYPFIARTSRRSLAARERDVNRWLKARRA